MVLAIHDTGEALCCLVVLSPWFKRQLRLAPGL